MTAYVNGSPTHRVIFMQAGETYQALAVKFACNHSTCALCLRTKYPLGVYHSKLPNGLAWAKGSPSGHLMSLSRVMYRSLRAHSTDPRRLAAVLRVEEL